MTASTAARVALAARGDTRNHVRLVLLGRQRRRADPQGRLRGRSAFDALYRRYARPVFGLALRRLGDRGRAEDAVQETFASVWRAAGSYKPERGPGAPWLYAVARNAIVDNGRAARASGRRARRGRGRRRPGRARRVRLDRLARPPGARGAAGERAPGDRARLLGRPVAERDRRPARHPLGTVKTRTRTGFGSLPFWRTCCEPAEPRRAPGGDRGSPRAGPASPDARPPGRDRPAARASPALAGARRWPRTRSPTRPGCRLADSGPPCSSAPAWLQPRSASGTSRVKRLGQGPPPLRRSSRRAWSRCALPTRTTRRARASASGASADGNWPMVVTVRGLDHLGRGDYYALVLTRKGSRP